MLKRTLYISKPYHLSVKNRQMVLSPKTEDDSEPVTVPVEDIGFVVIEDPQTSVTPKLLEELTNNNVATIFCDSKHLPHSMLLNLDGNHLQNGLFREQLAASEPLKKNLWKQTVEAKIANQAAVLKYSGANHKDLQDLATKVQSGDAGNAEATAARKYWRKLFGANFVRERYGPWPNPLLNYGYAILRAAVARALAGSGLLVTMGIHHANRYNAYCLADDIMEPYRPYVDVMVYQMNQAYGPQEELDKELKMEMLRLLATDIHFEGLARPLMVGLSLTTASLAACFAGQKRQLRYPKLAEMPNS